MTMTHDQLTERLRDMPPICGQACYPAADRLDHYRRIVKRADDLIRRLTALTPEHARPIDWHAEAEELTR
jgi:hypothetical protein